MPTKNIYETAQSSKSSKTVDPVLEAPPPKAMTVRVPKEVWYIVCHKLIDEPDKPSWNEFLVDFLYEYANGAVCRKNGEVHRVRPWPS